MDRDNQPNSINELLAALADGELDLREHPEALAQIAQDEQAAQRIACQQQLREACAKAMDAPDMKCPEALAATLVKLAEGDTAQQPAAPAAPAPSPKPVPAYDGPPVIARIGRWVPTAIAAVLVLAAGVLFIQASNTGGGLNAQAAAFLSVDQIDNFSGRHQQCAIDPDELKQTEQFGSATEFDQLPGRLGNYFQTSTDGMQLSLDGMGYDYELTGACSLPGRGAVHIVYRNQENPEHAISVWVMPAGEQHQALEVGNVYSVAGQDLEHPVIFWRDGGLLYYLVGDSREDCDRAVQELREPV